MTVRRATPEDAPALTAFGRRVFAATFAAENAPGDLQSYLDGAYVESRQREELNDSGIDTLLLEIDGSLAAFAQLRNTPPPSGIGGDAPVELWRFYVDPGWHGRGVAQHLMRAVEDAARVRHATELWLGVWEKNVRAQVFYRKEGFTVAGSQIFMMGADPQRDLVMIKGL